MFFVFYISTPKGADFRHTPHGSPQTTNVYGKSAPYGCSSNNICSLASYGGDCVAIEQYVFALFAECDGKITQNYSISNLFIVKIAQIMLD